jgi:hypothetical protein
MTSLAVAPLSDGRLQFFALDARNWATVKLTLLTPWKLTKERSELGNACSLLYLEQMTFARLERRANTHSRTATRCRSHAPVFVAE